jgi:hypothetical protein
MGPAASNNCILLFPAARLWDRGPPRQGRLRRRLRRPGPAPSLTRTAPLTPIGASRETRKTQVPGDARGPVRHAPLPSENPRINYKPLLDTAPLLQG